ncbi:Siderophore iron transporter mirB [Vanrija pseudolonga]|uniref:Siderophore iron transporter mirB n=1 Tax=Vanrija pseudolonga TaxID=143232 RepID=A0AAF1BGN1_9TREE|nr:Siderophore iron transporter mirB [Vanrija pseudolonga]
MKVDQSVSLIDTAAATHHAAPTAPDSPVDEKSAPPADEEAVQTGVKTAEAITQTWSKSSLRTIYAFFWLTYAVNAFQSSITGNLTAYVTSGFSQHSLIPTISIVSNVMSGVAYMVLAKILNLWDRSYGYLAMTLLATLGLILSAACTEIYTYCTAQVFYSIGFIGIIFCVDVLTADTSHLRNRGLAFAFTSSPWIITAYAGPAMSQRFYESNWRWGYGAFAIILPVVAVPMFVFLQVQKRRAVRLGAEIKEKSGRTVLQSVIYYIVQFDVLGVFLVSAGMVLFLLPFSIATSIEDEWRSASVITMLVIGVACLAAFVLVERYFSPVPFIPFHLLSSRTVVGACMLNVSWQIAYYCWASYFTSYLQVVYNLSISKAGYIASIYDVVATVWLLPVGYLIRRTGYFKWVVLVSVPIYTLGEGLMIYFRKPGHHIGWIVFTQVLISIGGSAFTLVEQVAVLAAGSHNDAAGMLALLGLSGYFGGAIGNSVSGAIWTNTLPSALQSLLPEEALPDWEEIYESLEVQLSYDVGTDVRTAISLAYAQAQSRMLIAGTAIMGMALVSILLIKNIKVSDIEQVKGVLF